MSFHLPCAQLPPPTVSCGSHKERPECLLVRFWGNAHVEAVKIRHNDKCQSIH